MFTVILSEIAAVRIDTACSMPARKLAGAAKAAASYKRLMVIPPDVTATAEPGSIEAVLADPVTAADSIGIAKGAKGFPSLSQDAHGEKVAKISPPRTLKSWSSPCDGTSGFVNNRLGMKLPFIDQSLFATVVRCAIVA